MTLELLPFSSSYIHGDVAYGARPRPTRVDDITEIDEMQITLHFNFLWFLNQKWIDLCNLKSIPSKTRLSPSLHYSVLCRIAIDGRSIDPTLYIRPTGNYAGYHYF